MRFHILSFLLILVLLVIVGCSDNSNDNIISVQQGDIFGTVTDKETGFLIKGAFVQIGTKSAQTGENGKYILKEFPFSNSLDVIVTSSGYEEYRNIVSLQQELLSYDVALIPIQSQSPSILAVLDAISEGIESLDAAKIPDVQSHFSKTYVAGDDEATAFAIFAGVVPPNYNAIPDTLNNIIKKYSMLKFKFANPEVKFDGDLASVQMRFMVNAVTNPPDPKKWEIVVDGKMIYQNQDGVWKMTLWGLIPPFLKFEENPF